MMNDKKKRHGKLIALVCVISIIAGVVMVSIGVGNGGIEALEDFFRRIHMPTSLRELGVSASDEDLVLMAHKCAVGVGGAMGSAKLLREEDMLAIFRASV